MYTVLVQPSADRSLRKLPDDVQRRIVAAIDELHKDPRPGGCKKLKGEDNLWRIRVGDYRVVYTIQDKKLVILVVRIAHRKDAYQN